MRMIDPVAGFIPGWRMPTARTQVIVVGAGPTGLTLAAELAGSGVKCRVLERRSSPSTSSRAFGLMPHSLELLDMRGRADSIIDSGVVWAYAPLGDGKGWLDFSLLDSRFPFMLILPQSRTEEHLERWAKTSGAEIIRNSEVKALEQDDGGVTLTVESDGRQHLERADFVVGCDGVRSTVRSLAQIGFRGASYGRSLIVADVRLGSAPDPIVQARFSRRGTVAVFPFGDGTFRVIILDHERMGIPVHEPVLLDEIRESTRAILGTGLDIENVTWASRYQSDHRQALSYRSGRVLLAGDAAHTHIPSGGQGLQVGIQDAMNLGWKLAAVVTGRARPALLDSYQNERRPVASATIRNTDLAFRYETSRSAIFRLLRWAFMRIVALRSIQVGVIRQFAGVTIRYRLGAGGASLVGRRIPDARILLAGGGSTRIYELMQARRFVLLDRTPERTFSKRANPIYANRVDIVEVAAVDRSDLPSGVLIRPDGFVVWTSRDRRARTMEAALERWCGDSDQTSPSSRTVAVTPGLDRDPLSQPEVDGVTPVAAFPPCNDRSPDRAPQRSDERARIHDPK